MNHNNTNEQIHTTNSSYRIDETNQKNYENPNGSDEFYELRQSDVRSSETIRVVLSDESLQTPTISDHSDKKSRKKRTTRILSEMSEVSESINVKIDESKISKRQRKVVESVTTRTYTDVTLYPHQNEHANKLTNILTNHPFALDLSPMGTGKTYCATHIAKTFGFKRVLVIAPISVIPKWKHMRDTHGLQLSDAMSYCSLRSVKCKQPKHGLLTRIDRRSEVINEDTGRPEPGGERDVVEFHATDLWKKYVSEGILLVVDEIQNVKNISSQYFSVKELIREILGSSSMSKVLLLSGTPIDKTEQVKNLFRAIGLITKNLCQYDPGLGRTIARGLDEIIQHHESYVTRNDPLIRDVLRKVREHRIYNMEMMRYQSRMMRYQRAIRNSSMYTTLPELPIEPIAPEALTYVNQQMYNNHVHESIHNAHHIVDRVERANHGSHSLIKHVNECMYRLFCDIFCKKMASAMQRPDIPCRVHKRNAYYYVPHECRELLQKGVVALRSATSFNEATGEVHFENENRMNAIHGITRALQMIETAKISIFVREAKELLEMNPNYKVVICLNYVDTIKDVQRDLSEYDPLVLYGATNETQRGRVISQFQQENTRYRVLIGNIECLSTGIDLDDKNGAYPRFALVSPNYRIITLEQLTYRFLRMDTKSDTDLHFVFGRVLLRNGDTARDYEELPIINALAKKSNVMRDVTNATNVSNEELPTTEYKYPGSYETWTDSKLNSR
jgi:superfamily II DNA or RNA helicase